MENSVVERFGFGIHSVIHELLHFACAILLCRFQVSGESVRGWDSRL